MDRFDKQYGFQPTEQSLEFFELLVKHPVEVLKFILSHPDDMAAMTHVFDILKVDTTNFPIVAIGTALFSLLHHKGWDEYSSEMDNGDILIGPSAAARDIGELITTKPVLIPY